MADPLSLPLHPPQSQLHPLEPSMKPVATDSAAPAAVAASSAKTKSTTTTRVYLRVKRRRPAPTLTTDPATTTATASSTQFANNNSNGDTSADNSVGGAPDRIKISLACLPAAAVASEGSSKKRRRLDKKEELALIQRLDSASIHTTTNNNGNNNITDNANAMPSTPPRRNSADIVGGSNPNAHDPMNTNNINMNDGARTPPHPSSPTNTTATNANDSIDMTPAPPTKPKRTVIFRKMNDLQKRILLLDNDESESGHVDVDNGRDGMNIASSSPSSSSNLFGASTATTTATNATTTTTNDAAPSTPNSNSNRSKWSSKGEEKSKWLRIVDVMLNEEDYNDNNDFDQLSDQHQLGSSIASSTTNGHHANNNNTNNHNDIVVVGSGQRVNRMRPRPTDLLDNNDETNGDTTNTNNNEHCQGERSNTTTGGQNRRKKRRKLGLVIEQSRTILESDFWKKNPQTTTAATTTTTTTASAMNAANASGSFDNSNTANNNNNNSHLLDPFMLQLIDQSLSTLQQLGGGTISPHLAFLQTDPRLHSKFIPNTPTGRLMINHALSSGPWDTVELPINFPIDNARGRTVLHYAALWGDVWGVSKALEMGADPTIFDTQGNTPVGLARRGSHEHVVALLVEGEKKAVHAKNIVENNGDEYYYEMYCLETEEEEEEEDGNETARVTNNSTSSSAGGEGSSSSNNNNNNNKQSSSRFLRPKADSTGATTINTDSIPDLERSSVLSEDDDQRGGGCALIELQKGFGYWNERGELVLEAENGANSGVIGANGETKQGGGANAAAEDDDRFVQKFYHTMDGKMEENDSMGDDEGDHDSNDEGYDGNDYPEDVSFGMESDYDDYCDADAYAEGCHSDDDDDSVDNWKNDFRNRKVNKSDLFSYGCGLDGADDGSFSSKN